MTDSASRSAGTCLGSASPFRYLLGLLFPSPKFMRIRYALTRRRELAGAYLRRFYPLSWSGLKAVMVLLTARLASARRLRGG